MQLYALAYNLKIYASAYRESCGGATLPGGLTRQIRERPGGRDISFHRIIEREGAAEVGGGGAVTTPGEPIQGRLGFWAGSQVLFDAAVYGRSADAQSFSKVGAVAGAICPEAEIGDFV